MISPIQLIDRPAQPTLAIRTLSAVENLPQVLGIAYSEIGGYLDELGEPPAGHPFVAYYNLDIQNLEIEIGFPVAKTMPGKGRILPGQIPAGQVVTCLYTGSYDQMEPAYEEINTWMGEHAVQPSGVVYEFYLNSPMEVPMTDLQTEILFPLAA